MYKKIGIIGVGHLAEYLLKGLMKTERDFEFFLADPFPERAEKLAESCSARVFTDNQAAVDQSEIIILISREIIWAVRIDKQGVVTYDACA